MPRQDDDQSDKHPFIRQGEKASLTGCWKTPICGVALILALLDEEIDFGESQ
ncbi:MAG: hypothetical protein MUP27_07995 [Desulfobacterales bacterium]|nr:hypothetical protein [Desulfobacterales bacterium]